MMSEIHDLVRQYRTSAGRGRRLRHPSPFSGTNAGIRAMAQNRHDHAVALVVSEQRRIAKRLTEINAADLIDLLAAEDSARRSLRNNRDEIRDATKAINDYLRNYTGICREVS